MITPDRAKRMGFYPLTTPYSPAEVWMLDNVIYDMQKGKIAYVLVEEDEGVSIWRTLEGAL